MAAAERGGLWMVAINEASRLGVRIVPMTHTLCRMNQYDARLIRRAPARGGGLVLLVWRELSPDEKGRAALRALAAISQRAWRTCGQNGKVGA